jgi:hypothetical protein
MRKDCILAVWFFVNPNFIDDVAKVLWQWAKERAAELENGIVSKDLWRATSGNHDIHEGDVAAQDWKDDFDNVPVDYHDIFYFFKKYGVCPGQNAMLDIMSTCNALHDGEVLVYTCEQRHGGLVYVPPGWIHIVFTQKVPCIKLAWDAVYLDNIPKYILVARDIACGWFGNREVDMGSEPFNSYDWMKVQKFLTYVVEECIEVIPEVEFPGSLQCKEVL